MRYLLALLLTGCFQEKTSVDVEKANAQTLSNIASHLVYFKDYTHGICYSVPVWDIHDGIIGYTDTRGLVSVDCTDDVLKDLSNKPPKDTK